MTAALISVNHPCNGFHWKKQLEWLARQADETELLIELGCPLIEGVNDHGVDRVGCKKSYEHYDIVSKKYYGYSVRPMTNVIQPFHLLVIAVSGWLNRHQQAVIDYLMEENRVLKEQLEGQRLRFTDQQRIRLAVKVKVLGGAGHLMDWRRW